MRTYGAYHLSASRPFYIMGPVRILLNPADKKITKIATGNDILLKINMNFFC
jgi:hypothetical protein